MKFEQKCYTFKYLGGRSTEAIEFISIKPSVAMGSTARESYATHSTFP
jgi:hypothetical protein